MKSTLIKGTDTWQPLCVYFSPANGDLLVGMFSYVEETCKVNRYNITGQYIQAIQHDNKGQRLYRGPKYIVENNNGDVIVSDFNQVVVTDDEGKYRFTYTGIPSGSLIPRGICTDLLSHILVCDHNTNTLHIIDKDGNLLSQILTRKQGLHTPYSVCYDNKTHFLWVGSWEDNTVCVYKYLTRECCRTGTDVADQSNKFNTRKIFVNV
ncbi:uncharacterized protein LOC134260739 [Saccostrea cucullata]|uniref:uncharacterized protein LOC134260739 n=1 Tax=Saccostrea cuccullata TaxID=36930 RepID=UPI002ED5E2B9